MRDTPELPEIKDASVGTLRLEGTLAKRLPSMPSGELNDLAFTDARRVEAEKLMNDMRAAFDISRQYDKRSTALSKAKSRQMDRQLRNQDSSGRINRRKAQGNNNRAEKRTIRNYARNVLGMGTDLYR